jgi:hypothetical protein
LFKNAFKGISQFFRAVMGEAAFQINSYVKGPPLQSIR